MSTSGQPSSKRIQQKEEEAEALIAEILFSWNELAECDIAPLLEYEERTTEIEDKIGEVTQQLDLDTDDLQTVEEQTVILRRIEMVAHAQISTRKQALDQRLDYLSAWISELRALAEETNIDPEMSTQLEQLMQWADYGRQFLNRDKYTQLLSEGGSYNIDSLKARIEEIEQSLRQSADSSTEQAYLRDVAVICGDALSTVVDRIEHVVGSTPAERETIAALENDINTADSGDDLIASLTDLRQLYVAYEREANQLIEIAVFLDAVEDAHAADISGIQNQIEDVRTELKNRDLESARLQVKQLVSWEQELDQFERFRLELVRQDGDVLEAANRSPFTIDEAMTILADLYEAGEVTTIEVTLA